MSSITTANVLRKIFVRGFYRVHAGMLIFLFATVFSSCFFVNTLGELPHGTYFFWHFIVTVTLVSNPLMAVLFLAACLLYAAKNLQFISGELQKPSNHFLFYSINALPAKQQLGLVLVVELWIFFPLIVYALFCAFIGFITQHCLIPGLVVAYLLSLAALCSCHIFRVLNKINGDKAYWYQRAFRWRRKPFFILFSFFVLRERKAVFFLTKLASLAVIPVVFYNYPALRQDLKTSTLVIILMMAVHVVLLYQERDFNNRFLSFAYNFPYSLTRLFFGYTINYLLFLLPEIIWLFTWFSLPNACVLLLSGGSFLLLIRSISFSDTLHLFSFLKIVFLMLCVLFIMTAYHFYQLIAPLCLPLSYIIFRENYFYKTPA